MAGILQGLRYVNFQVCLKNAASFVVIFVMYSVFVILRGAIFGFCKEKSFPPSLIRIAYSLGVIYGFYDVYILLRLFLIMLQRLCRS